MVDNAHKDEFTESMTTVIEVVTVSDWLNSTKYGKLLLALIGRKSTGVGIFVV